MDYSDDVRFTSTFSDELTEKNIHQKVPGLVMHSGKSLRLHDAGEIEMLASNDVGDRTDTVTYNRCMGTSIVIAWDDYNRCMGTSMVIA